MATIRSEMPPQWFAAHTVPRHEKHVSGRLRDRDIENYLPLYHAVRLWKNRCRVELELPLFPTYLFVRIPTHKRFEVLSVPGVVSLVGSKRELWPLPEFEVEAMRAGLDQRNPEPHVYLAVGERVRIRYGPLAGLEGVLLRMKNSLRVVLTIDQIMRSVSVEVNITDLEPIYPRSALASQSQKAKRAQAYADA